MLGRSLTIGGLHREDNLVNVVYADLRVEHGPDAIEDR